MYCQFSFGAKMNYLAHILHSCFPNVGFKIRRAAYIDSTSAAYTSIECLQYKSI